MVDKEKLIELLRDEKIREAVKRIVEYEEKREEEFKTNPIYQGLENLSPFWELMDIPVEFHIVKKLIFAGVVKKVGRRDYILVNREEVKKVLEDFEKYREMSNVTPVCEELVEIPDDLFDTIIGYEDVKKLFLMSIKAEKPTHILLIGPPASAKTVFLLEVARLKGAFYLLGGTTTKAGLIDQLFTLQPRYVLLDEIDKMNREDFTALLSLMETGIVKEVKHGKTREIVLPAKVYAACNVEKNIPPENLSRFQFKLHFKPYTKQEFIEIACRVLTMREHVDEELAKYIALKVSELTRDVRDCVGIGRLAKDKETVDFLIEVKRKYMSDRR